MINLWFVWFSLSPQREHILYIGHDQKSLLDASVITDGGSKVLYFTAVDGKVYPLYLEGGFEYKARNKLPDEDTSFGEIYLGEDNWGKKIPIDYDSPFTDELLQSIYDYCAVHSGYNPILRSPLLSFIKKIEEKRE